MARIIGILHTNASPVLDGTAKARLTYDFGVFTRYCYLQLSGGKIARSEGIEILWLTAANREKSPSWPNR